MDFKFNVILSKWPQLESSFFRVAQSKINTFLRPLQRMESKIFLSYRCVFPTRYLPIELALKRCGLVLNKKFFPPNRRKFAVECDWENKNPQNVQTSGFLEK